MEDEHPAGCQCGVPENAIVTNVLTVVEYMHPDTGELWKADYSHNSADEPLEFGKVMELTEWARMFAQAEIMADLVRDHLFYED